MITKVRLALTALGLVMVAVIVVLYVTNRAPLVPAVSAVAARQDRPYVVKIHAQWCPVCVVTKGVWSQIERTYSGRVNLVVLDFTTHAAADASRAEARRLGLDQLLDAYDGATGTIVVLDGRTRQVAASIAGSRDFADYRAAIDAALKGAATPSPASIID